MNIGAKALQKVNFNNIAEVLDAIQDALVSWYRGLDLWTFIQEKFAYKPEDNLPYGPLESPESVSGLNQWNIWMEQRVEDATK